ncbi:hypothetical protein EVAR_28856_1 [Eumeta japonica]|uniref:Uncharacterized protein n=1 Tax=Eumeta variegata TaxID=151549 RepID=A0A4C1YKX7_EUMVA|nr:hypothetical protein EVAR_28856_1 [Eumeta japonica]
MICLWTLHRWNINPIGFATVVIHDGMRHLQVKIEADEARGTHCDLQRAIKEMQEGSGLLPSSKRGTAVRGTHPQSSRDGAYVEVTLNEDNMHALLDSGADEARETMLHDYDTGDPLGLCTFLCQRWDTLQERAVRPGLYQGRTCNTANPSA